MAKNYTTIREFSKTIMLDIYGYEVEIVFTNNLQGSGEKRAAPIPEKAEAVTMAYANLPKSTMIFTRDVFVGSVAHECSHVLHNLMQYVGARFEDEFVAYHLGYLVTQVYAALAAMTTKERRLKKKRQTK